jgi:hypothetical protein
MEHLKTEKEVVNYFLSENRHYLSAGELDKYKVSLDCALATLMTCEALGIDYPESYKRIRESVMEEGEFWDACVKQALKEYSPINLEIPSNKLLIQEKAVFIGIQWLLEGFKDGL